MKTHLCVLTVLALATSIHAAIIVGPAGVGPLIFDNQPLASDWSTLSVPGGSGDIAAAPQMDTEVQLLDASDINISLPTAAGSPPGALQLARWDGITENIVTRPTNNRMTILMARLRNNSGVAKSSLRISYDLGIVMPVLENIPGHLVYFSLTGAANSWQPIAGLSGDGTAGAKTNTVNFSATPWPDGSDAYLLWADDNGPGTDPGNTLDNLILEWPDEFPSITQQPQSLTVTQGQSATFTVTATGTPPLSYVWHRSPPASIIDWEPIELPSISLSNAQPTHAGNYYLVVSNASGSVTSSVATLTVLTPPVISQQPQSQTVTNCDTATFSVAAMGTEPLSYQWRRDDLPLAGQTNTTLTLSNAQPPDAGVYSVIVSSAAGVAVSEPATLTVVVPLTLVMPSALTASVNESCLAFMPDVTEEEDLHVFNNCLHATVVSHVQTPPAGTPVGPGRHAITLRVTDSYGNSATGQVQFVVLDPGRFDWGLQFGGTNVGPVIDWPTSGLGPDAGLSITLDPTGDLYVTGNFEGQADFGGTNLQSAGGVDIFVAKLKSSGELLWVRREGGTNNDNPLRMAVDRQGNLFVCGTFTGTMPFGDTNLTSAGSGDFYVASFTGDGAFRFAITAGGTNSDSVSAILVESDGNLLVSGTAGRGARLGGFTLNAVGASDAFVARISPQGDFLNVWQGNADNSMTGLGLALDRDGNFALFGNVTGNGRFGSLSFTNNGPMYVVKFNRNGDAQWARVATRGQANTALTPRHIGMGPTGDVYFTAYFRNPVIFGSNVVAQSVGLYNNYLLVKYRADGEPQWVVVGGNAASSESQGFTVDLRGNPWVCGFENGRGTADDSGTNFFVKKFSPDGELLLSAAAGTRDTVAYGVAVDSNDCAYVTGWFAQTLSFAPVGPTLVSTGDPRRRDAFVAKVRSACAPVITQQPQSLIVTQGQSAMLTVVAIGPPPLSYSWRSDPPANILEWPPAELDLIALPNAQPFHAGNYFVIVSNPYGSVTSTVATLTILTPPVITQQPQSLTVTQGQSATFTVTATGTPPLSYSWRSDPPANILEWPPAELDLIALPNAQPFHAGNYFVIVSNPYGSVTSTVATLTVIASPSLLCPGDATVYSASPVGVPIRYSVQGTGLPDTNHVVTCTPPSGALFLVGINMVNCQLLVTGQVIHTCSFNVIVLPSNSISNQSWNLTLSTIITTNHPDLGRRPTLFPLLVLRTNLVSWVNDEFGELEGRATLSLSNSPIHPTNGYLFVQSSSSDPVTRIGSAKRTAEGWEIESFSADSNVGTEVQTEGGPLLRSPDASPIECMFVPFNTPNLTAGEVFGGSGQVLAEHGEFVVGRISPGVYEMELTGKSGPMGQLLLNPLPASSYSPGSSARRLLTSTYSNGVFRIYAREAIPSPSGFNPNAPLRDTDFTFAFVDYASSVVPGMKTLYDAPGMVLQSAGGVLDLSWPLAAVDFYQLQCAESPVSVQWSNVTFVMITNGPVVHANVTTVAAQAFYRLSSVEPAGCTNGGFEMGDLTGWRRWNGTSENPGQTEVFTPPFEQDDRHLRMTAGNYDPLLESAGILLPVTFRGNYSARLGNGCIGKQGERLAFTFTVTPENRLFTFSYALVLENPPPPPHTDGHLPAEQPYFTYRMYQGTPALKGKPIKELKLVADKNNTKYFTPVTLPLNAPHPCSIKPIFNPLVYRDWDCSEVIDLSACMGRTVTIEFETADCSKGGDFGYAYIDAVCQAPDDSLQVRFNMQSSICEGEDLQVDGSATEGELEYLWAIEESDAYWGRKPWTELSEWFVGQAGPFNLTDWLKNSTFGPLQCDRYYRVKLAARNSCVAWKETVKLLHVRCGPRLDMAKNIFLCCCDSNQVTLGPTNGPEPGVQYMWSSIPSGFTSTIANPTVTVTNCDIIYILKATATNGCVATRRTHVKVLGDFDVQLFAEPVGKSGLMRLTPIWTRHKCPTCFETNLPGFGKWQYIWPISFLWNTGARSFTIDVKPTAGGFYFVVLSTPCNTHLATISLDTAFLPSGPFPSIVCPNVFTPNGDGVNDYWYARDTSKPPDYKPAYNAFRYRFQAFSRWGTRRVVLKDETDCNGFTNCTIPYWNGNEDNGNEPVVEGTYFYIFELENTTSGGLQTICHDHVNIFR